MTKQPPTKPGKLSDLARHVVLPSGITSTGWPAVRDKAATFGVEFDAWQDGAGRVILAKRSDGSYACSVGGVVMSIPRQVGKTFLIGAIVFAMCLLNPGMRVLWTAHHSDTATETFQSLQGFSRRKKVRPHVAKVLVDAMTIKFVNGSSIMFGARERGFGRGMTKVGLLVFDEAQILTERASADMVPTTNTINDALVIYTGTPPKPSDPSEVFTNRRAEALAGDSDDMAYIEFSADRGCDPMSKKQWAKANPSYPGRTNDAAMLRMKKNLTPDSFTREALGIWDEDLSGKALVSSKQWKALESDAPSGGETFYGIKFSPDGEMMALSVALRPKDGPIHVEGVFHKPMYDGIRWLVDWLQAPTPGDPRERPRWSTCGAIVVDGKANAPAFVKALLTEGCKERQIKRPNTDEVVAAHSLWLQAVRNGEMTVIDDPAMLASVTGAGRRKIGNLGGWGLEPLTEEVDVTLAESGVLAHFGAATVKKRKGTVYV